jgi:hypothetical protein
MKASRTDASRLIDYSSPAIKGDGAAMLRRGIQKFCAGIRGPRENPVSEKQIVQWFRSTDAEFVREQITEACTRGLIRCCQKSLTSSRRYRGAYVYEAVRDED